MTGLIARQLETISREIREQEELARQGARGAISCKIEVGKRLLAARVLLPHGEFGEWAQAEFGWSRQHIARHIRLARNGTRVLQMAGGDATLRAALRAIAAPREEPERWVLVGVLDSQPQDGADLAAVAAVVTSWKVRRG